MQMNPYLSFNGQCEAAFKFYEQCLGGQLGAIGLANSSHGYRQRNERRAALSTIVSAMRRATIGRLERTPQEARWRFLRGHRGRFLL